MMRRTLGLVALVGWLSACGAEPEPCRTGTWARDGETECVAWTDCEAGERVAQEGSADADRICAGCPSGTFSNATNAVSCVTWTTCEAGTHVAEEGSATRDPVCASCPAGTHTSGPNQSHCVPLEGCAPGTVQTAPGSSRMPPVCEACAAGEHCPGGELPAVRCDGERWDHDAAPSTACVPRTACAAGSYVSDEGDATSDRSCATCASGTYSLGGNEASCTEWSSCPASEYVSGEPSATADRACAACPAGTDSDDINAASCTAWTVWIRQFGTTDGDIAESVTVDASGNVIVAGRTRGALPGQLRGGGWDAFVRKYDADGSVIWTRQFGRFDYDNARSVTVDGSGHVIVAGTTGYTLPGQIHAGRYDAFVRKYDANGTELWTRQFGSGGDDEVYAVAVDASGNVLVAGLTDGTLPGAMSAGQRDAFVRKYDANGTELWTRQFGTGDADTAASVIADASGNVLVAGLSEGTFPGETSAGMDDAFVRKYDADGTELWTRQFGTSDDDRARSVSVDASGAVLVAGITFGALPAETSAGSGDAFVRRFDAAGTVLWTRQFGTSEGDGAYAAMADESGNVIVVGTTGGALPGETSAGVSDAFVRKYDAGGTELSTRQFGTSRNDSAASVTVDGSGNAIVAGYTWGALPGQMNAGDDDAFVMKLVL